METTESLKAKGQEIAQIVEETNDVAKTIVKQINGLDFWARARWGVRTMLSRRFDGRPGHVGHPGVQFDCTHGIIVKIALMPSDTYRVQIGKLGRKGSAQAHMFVMRQEAEDVYAEDLVHTIYGMFSKNYP